MDPAPRAAESRPACREELWVAPAGNASGGDADCAALPEGEWYAEALSVHLESPSHETWRLVQRRARELARVAPSVEEALSIHWQSAHRRGGALKPVPCADDFSILLRAEREIATAFDAMARGPNGMAGRLAPVIAGEGQEANALLNSLPAAVFVKNAAGRYVTANRLYCEAIGVPRERLVTMSDSDLFPPEVAQRFNERDRKAFDTAEPIRQEELIERNGEQFTYLFVKAPLKDPEGEVCGLIGLGFDVTKRTRIELEHARMAGAIDAAGDAVMIAGADGSVEYVNPAFERLTGYRASEVVHGRPEILGARYASERAETEARGAMAEGSVWQGFVVHLRKDGTAIESDETIAPIRDAAGRITSHVYVLRDIAERRRMVQTLEQAVMVKSEFTNMVSHELRTPLTAIKESILVVADKTAGPLNERQNEFLKIATRNLERLHRLIDDTLDFSKIERGEFRIDIEPADLNGLVREIVQQQRLAASKNGLRLEMSLDAQLGEVPLDSDRISQVLVNLIGNAVRYCERGWIEVTTTKVGREALVKVQDTGPGIPADKLDFIFDAFVQLSTGDKRRSGGTGLGLAITRQIVEMHGGSIWAESEPGRGSAFYFSLPLEQEEDAARR